MTENKRFEEQNLENHLNRIYDTEKGRVVFDEDIVDVLNELDKENRKLTNELNLSKLNLKEKNEGFDKIHKMYIEQIEENKELKKENNELKQQFILLLKKLGKKNVQCSFCEHGEHYTELVDGYYEHRFICHKKGQEYTQRSFCEDWKIKVKE